MDISQVVDIESFDWESFIKTEEKIRYVNLISVKQAEIKYFLRTLSYIFLLDGGFVIFNNTPPRMVVSELEMGLTCPDECFHAPSASECLAALRIWTRKVPNFAQYSIASVIETMFQNDLSVEKKELYAHFGMLNLFTIVTGKLPQQVILFLFSCISLC